ncbi:MAG: putative short chain dehydrogenase [Acidimicrobiales bacterium]|nr:putative short chain dehydrogenase [Acidimicrobiales bacterium]
MHRSELEPLIDLRGRTAIVTGGRSGIGEAIALGFAAAGASVLIVSRNAEACDEVAARIRADGGRAAGFGADMSVLDSHAEIVGAALEAFGRVDILVNNAAVLRPHHIRRLSPAEFDEIFATNVRGTLFLCQAAFDALAADGGGTIINVGAVGAIAPMPGIGAYSASKAAVVNLTRLLANEWAEHGVRVNALVPGPVATEMILPRDLAAKGRFVEEIGAGTLMQRIGEPHEMVGPAIFLASEASSYVTGQCLVVDGGMLARSAG